LVIAAAALLVSYVRGWIGTLNFWIYFVPALAIGIIAWVLSRQTRRELAKLREGSIADANAAYLKPTPWRKLSPDFLLHPTKQGNYRLRIETATRWLTQYPIDAEIQCTAEQAAELESSSGQKSLTLPRRFVSGSRIR
jgi:hypothetical protein